jgi:hypothetical protein
MKSNNNSDQKRDDDLIFTPLNIKEPFKPNNSLFLSPLNTDELYFLNNRNNIFTGYPPSMLNEYNTNNTLNNYNRASHNPEKVGHFGDIASIVGEMYETSTINKTPGTTPPEVSTSTPSTSTMIPEMTTTIPNTTPMTPGVGTTTAFPSPTMPTIPLMPYPSSIPSLELDDLNTLDNLSPPPGVTEYSQEASSDDLYSYNAPEHPINATATTPDTINAVDILRNFDYSYDYTSSDNRNEMSSKDVDKIFEEIEKNHPGILATMKAYRVPYPISKVLIKKIIYITTKYINK